MQMALIFSIPAQLPFNV